MNSESANAQSKSQISLISLFGLVSVASLVLASFVVFGLCTTILIAALFPFVLIVSGLYLKQRNVAVTGARLIGIMLLLAPFALIALSIWTMNAHAVSPSQWKHLKAGMKTDQVLELLGEPYQIRMEDDGSQNWTYERSTWCQMTVYFSRTQKVEEFYHDH